MKCSGSAFAPDKMRAAKGAAAMVFYFSGTGNSQFVALEIAKITADEEVVAINQYLKSGKEAAFAAKGPLVFVSPTYCWRLPRVVEAWIMGAGFEGSKDAYFVLTCGGSCGNAAGYAKKLCDNKGLRFRGLAPVLMPENYLALFPTPDEGQCRQIIENAKPRIAGLAQRIASGKPFDEAPASLGAKLQSGPLNPLFYALFVHDKGFTVGEQCVSCGKCALRCPLNNIRLAEGRPVWGGNCTHCMACIGGCPTKTIEYKANSQNRHRHYIMNDALLRGNGGDGR